MIYIPHNVPSSKNTKRVWNKRLITAPIVQTYKDNTWIYYKQHKKDFQQLIHNIEPPYHVTLKFIRDSRRRFDYHNAVQIVADLMVQYEWIPDDNADYFIPVFLPYEYKKNDGGVYIGVLNHSPTT